MILALLLLSFFGAACDGLGGGDTPIDRIIRDFPPPPPPPPEEITQCSQVEMEACNHIELNNGLVCALDRYMVCREAPFSLCNYYAQNSCLGAKIKSGKHCFWDENRNLCRNVNASACGVYDLNNCQMATTTDDETCVIDSRFQECVAIDKDSLVSTFNPYIKNAVYTQPVSGASIYVPCLGKGSNYFKNDEEVNQFFVDISTRLEEDLALYRWGAAQYEMKRADKPFPFYPFQIAPTIPANILTIFNHYRPDYYSTNPDALPANSGGGAVYGPGLYTAFNPIDSMSYAPTYTQFACIQLTVKAGNLLLDVEDPIVAQRMGDVFLSSGDVERCNPPVLYATSTSDLRHAWEYGQMLTKGLKSRYVVVEDPTGISVGEFDGSALTYEQLRLLLCYPDGHASRYPVQQQYLLTHAQNGAHPGFSCDGYTP